eukprot:2751750-Lingulodinium_polyedra.AAC.1
MHRWCFSAAWMLLECCLGAAAVESTARGRNGSQLARSRTPRADKFSAYAWNAPVCDVQAAATAKPQFDHVIAQR